MSNARLHLRLTCVALTISLALAADWIAGPWFDVGSSQTRWLLFGLNLVLTAGSLIYLISQVWSGQKSAMRELEMLCRADVRDLSEETTPAAFPSLAHDDPWIEPLSRMRKRLAFVGERLQEFEHQRAVTESRSRRQETEVQRANAILSGLSDPVIAIDQYDELVLANPVAQDVLAINSQRTADMMFRDLVRCEKLIDLVTETRKRRSSSQRSCELELTDSAGKSHWYRATARTLPSGEAPREGQPTSQSVVAVLHDISSQKAAQKRNAEFVSAVSHEMKTPLAGIKAYVELLVDGDAEDQKTREEFLEIINSQADRLQRLVDNMLNLARIEAGVVIVNKQNRSLNELLEEALRVVQPAAEAKHISLVSDLSPLYLGVHVDRDTALQAAINLLSNAVKYTPSGGRVTLRSRLAAGEVRFDVEDNGVGLSPEDCQKVFEKFYRVHKDKDMAQGTGLGLPLVKHIIEDVHNGRVQVESTPGQGSVFSVILPSAGTMSA